MFPFESVDAGMGLLALGFGRMACCGATDGAAVLNMGFGPSAAVDISLSAEVLCRYSKLAGQRAGERCYGFKVFRRGSATSAARRRDFPAQDHGGYAHGFRRRGVAVAVQKPSPSPNCDAMQCCRRIILLRNTCTIQGTITGMKLKVPPLPSSPSRRCDGRPCQRERTTQPPVFYRQPGLGSSVRRAHLPPTQTGLTENERNYTCTRMRMRTSCNTERHGLFPHRHSLPGRYVLALRLHPHRQEIPPQIMAKQADIVLPMLTTYENYLRCQLTITIMSNSMAGSSEVLGRTDAARLRRSKRW